MQFTVRHRYPVSAEEFWTSMFFDPDYNARLYTEGLGFQGITIDVQDREAGQVVRRRARVRPTLHAPAPLQKLLGDALTYEERGHRDAQGRWVSEIIPSRLADRIGIKTTMSTVPVDAGTCERVAEFEVTVRILGLGGMAEKFIERTLRESYERAAAFSGKWLGERAG